MATVLATEEEKCPVKMRNKTVVYLIAALTISSLFFPSFGSAAVQQAEEPDWMIGFRERRPALVRKLNDGWLAYARFRAAAEFEHQFPQVVRDFDAPQSLLSAEMFRAAWRGFVTRDSKVLRQLNQYERDEIGLAELADKLVFANGRYLEQDRKARARAKQEGGLTANACLNCEREAELYYLGGRAGGGSQFECFVLAEQYDCVCQNLCRPYGQRIECGVLTRHGAFTDPKRFALSNI
jgi:hypothetical protein